MGKIITDYSIGNLVYLKTDPEQKERIVIEITISEGSISYNLACGVNSSWHFSCEIAEEKDELKKLLD